MAFNIAEFNARVGQSGIASTSNFVAFISSGPKNTNILNQVGMEDGMRFRIESVNMPGRNMATLDQSYNGPVRQIPYRAVYTPVTFTVIMSRDMREREVFMRWQDYFLNHYRTNTTRGNYDGMFYTKYYDDGVGSMRIIQFALDQGGFKVATEVELIEAFPISVNDIQMSWGDEGYGRLQVEMRYRYTIEKNNYNPNSNAYNLNKSIADYYQGNTPSATQSGEQNPAETFGAGLSAY
jgi:hypothetical protein